MLEAYRLLDLSRLLPGPFTSHLLADLGMDVIKVEETQMRSGMGRDVFTPGGATPEQEIEAAAHNAVSRNKRSISLNLMDRNLRPDVQEVFYRLVRDADVVLDGYRPGTTKWMGIDYETLRQINPRIICCSISGYGQDGPYAQLAGHGEQFFAVSGLMSVMGRGEEGDEPKGPDLRVGDLSSGFFAANAIMAALLERETSSVGQNIDVSLAGAAMALALGRALPGRPRGGPNVPRRPGPSLSVLKCGDGQYLSTGNLETTFWENFCRAIGHEEFIPMRAATGEDWAGLVGTVREVFLTKSRDEWLQILIAANTCVAPFYMDTEEAFEDAQMQSIGMVWDLDHPSEGRVRQIGTPVRFSRTPTKFQKFAPVLGHSRARSLAATTSWDGSAGNRSRKTR